MLLVVLVVLYEAPQSVGAVEQAAASPGGAMGASVHAPGKALHLLAPVLVGIARGLLLLLRPLLVFLLRHAVHSRRFWERGIKVP